ncbi:hypothetical protein ACJIZ3_024703 [Penstemon smallii]|uniref:TFIIS N-terminal domain-containing protein n=1 Tax=Penstemon smallii TaxID=265156 RepID=A0ABD3TV64_9LAMI
MDLDDFRSFILDSGLDVWTWIDMAISLASSDYENELKNRRDGIIQRLYAPAFSKSCQSCCDQKLLKGEEEEEEEECKSKGIEQNEQRGDVGCDYITEQMELKSEKMESGNEEVGNEEEEDDDDDDDERGKVLEIKSLLDDQNQTESCLINLLQRLVDMDITLEVLKETDIGRHVTRLRKHSSEEVRRLVKILVRKWKDTVDEWVRKNTPNAEMSQFNGNKESTISHHSQHKNNIQNGTNKEVLPHGDTISNANDPCYYTPQNYGKAKDNEFERDHYSATRRQLHGNYQESQNAKKQRTTQEMDLPKANNAIVTNNRGNVPVKYW